MIYLAGPMSGKPNRNREAFALAAQDLRADGADVFNPQEHPCGTDMEGIALGVRLIAGDTISSLVVLPDWQISKGARLEVHVAAELQKPIRFLDASVALTREHRA